MTQTAALVTGAARGIGNAIARKFAERDRYDIVACLDIDDGVQKFADDLPGGVGYTVDVSDHEAIGDVVKDVEEEANIEAAVNNAGVSRYFWIGDLEPEEWDRIVDINLKGQYNVARWVTPHMYERERGALVNISSGAGTRGSVSGGVHYSASKGGVLGLTRGLAKQLSPHVRVNCVVPGLIDTTAGQPADDDEDGLWTEEGMETMRRLILLRRVGQPEEVANVVRFLCSAEASYMTGSILNVNGGAHLMPTQEFLMPEQSFKELPES